MSVVELTAKLRRTAEKVEDLQARRALRDIAAALDELDERTDDPGLTADVSRLDALLENIEERLTDLEADLEGGARP